MSLRTWNLPHPYIICNLRSPRREVKIARLSGKSVLCWVEGQDGEGRTWGEPEDWATEYPSCGFGRDTFSPVSCVTQEIQPMRWLQGSPGKGGPAVLQASIFALCFCHRHCWSSELPQSHMVESERGKGWRRNRADGCAFQDLQLAPISVEEMIC